jgi:hypothetical protein
MYIIYIHIHTTLVYYNNFHHNHPQGADKNKPHGHPGVLDHYDGKPLPFRISNEQSKKLDTGEPVTLTVYIIYIYIYIYKYTYIYTYVYIYIYMYIGVWDW